MDFLRLITVFNRIAVVIYGKSTSKVNFLCCYFARNGVKTSFVQNSDGK